MTQLLEQAVAKLASLTQSEQDQFASLIMAEVASEAQWVEAFAQNQGALKFLAEEALEENRRGECPELDLRRDFTDN